jgi:very-short-patch-repair endonuclease
MVDFSGKNNPFFGRHHTEEAKEKNRLAHLGKHGPHKGGWHHTKESKEKISKTLRGRPSPNKGKVRSESVKEKIRIANTGKRRSPESIERYRKANQKIVHPTGWHHTEETKQKLSMIHKGKTYHPFSRTKDGDKKISEKMRKYSQTENGKNKLQEARIIARRTKVSKPQLELFYLLKQIFIDAELEYTIKTKRSYRLADIAVPSLKIDFEYDGGYWHTNVHKDSDIIRDNELAEVGWLTCRINKTALKILSQQKIFILTNNPLMLCAKDSGEEDVFGF